MPRMSTCVPARKVLAAAVGAGTSVPLLDLLSPGLSAEVTAIAVTSAALLVGYLVPPAAADRLDASSPRPLARQITGTIIAS